ncbi:hypothetical protein [Rheinheimera pleomorphica]|uniref:hypothetical protein n=1 Tax=Rheinheimera pleomorphica TaxID=2703963 RepID=UPI0014207C32|nr:hypothetical protein [Rheinheimera pleomorphica]
MPKTLTQAVNFLETQWSSINDNKLKGILSEIRFKNYLREHNVHFVPGGWIISPGKVHEDNIPTKEKLCILPRQCALSWCNKNSPPHEGLTPAEVAAYNYFRQVGVKSYFAQPDIVNENEFVLPTPSSGKSPANYPLPYSYKFMEVSPVQGLTEVSISDMMKSFPARKKNAGLRCYQLGRIDTSSPEITASELISDLFWFEYSRYYLQKNYLLSNNDLDLFLIGTSGSCYPVELKSKVPAEDSTLGEWFGIDMGPFAKLAFFTANSMNTDALYVVEEVDAQRTHVQWLGIKFTELVKACSWVGQGGGTGMTGGRSATYKVPKAAFSPLNQLLKIL